jgi:hypothetical protein
MKEQYSVKLSKQLSMQEDELHLGYFKLDKL